MTEGPERPGEEAEDETRVRGDDAPASVEASDREGERRVLVDAAHHPLEGREEARGAATEEASGAGEPAGADDRPGEEGPSAVAAPPEPEPDSEPEPERAAEPAPTVVVRRGGGRGLALFALLLIVLLLGAIGGGAGWLYYTGEDPLAYVPTPTIDRLEARVTTLESELADTRRSARSALDREAELRRGTEDLSQALRALASDIASESPIDDRQWRIAETAYLLRVANLRAGVEGDRAGAEALLVAADELLRELDDFALLPVRERIADARAELRTFPAVDRTGLYLELEALGDDIAALPLDLREYVPPTDEGGAEEALAGDLGEEAPAQAWTDAVGERFAGLFDFRVHRPAPVRTLVAPGETEFLRHNLALKLEQAQLALLRKDQQVWDLALADAQRWTRDYFDVEEAAVDAVLRALERLADERVAVPAPDISAPHNELLRLRGRAAFLDPIADPGP